nr:MAG TPA: hypothetical protein [Bacteriophage sp.]
MNCLKFCNPPPSHGLIINKSIQKTGGQNYEFKHGKQAVL